MKAIVGKEAMNTDLHIAAVSDSICKGSQQASLRTGLLRRQACAPCRLWATHKVRMVPSHVLLFNCQRALKQLPPRCAVADGRRSQVDEDGHKLK